MRLLWLLLWCVLVCSAELSVHLDSASSFAKYASPQWTVNDDLSPLTLALSVRPETKDGHIFHFNVAKQGKTVFELRGALTNTYLQVDMYNEDGHKILNKPLSASPKLEMHRSYTMHFSLSLAQSELLFQFEAGRAVHYTVTQQLDIHAAAVSVVAGSDSTPSLIGCVSLLEVMGTSPSAALAAVGQRATSDCGGQECGERDCGKGTCLPLTPAACDCYSTGLAGPNCKLPPRTARLLSSRDDVLIYNPSKDAESPKRIAIEFRFSPASSSEGVLLHATDSAGNRIRVIVVNNSGTLSVESPAVSPRHIDFSLSGVPPSEFHSLLLTLTDTTLSLTVDGHTSTGDWIRFPFKQILFGSVPPPPDGSAKEVSFDGCLRNVYVDHADVVDRYTQGDFRVTASYKLSPNCDAPVPAEEEEEPMPVPLDEDGEEEEEEEYDEEGAGEGEEGASDDGTNGFINALTEDDDDDEDGPAPNTADLFPIPAKKPSEHQQPRSPCENSLRFQCRNGAACEMDRHKQLHCACRPGYAGEFCQFSVSPRTCAEARDYHHLPDGPTLIDVDGSSSSESAAVADCQGGESVIGHDMPHRTVLRDQTRSHSLYVVSYRDFPPSRLAALIAASESCQQHVIYECSKAPIGFQQGRTWFHVATGNVSLRQFGSVAEACGCLDHGCLKGGRCNCDAGGSANDEGVLRGQLAGLTRIVSLHDDGDINGTLSLAPLQCSGYAGSSPIRFPRPASLRVSPWLGEQVSLQFRTRAPGVILTNADNTLTIRLHDAHTINVTWQESSGEKSIVAESQAKLTDSHWHQLIVERRDGQLRVTVDARHHFADCDGSHIMSPLVLGHSHDGIVGCFRAMQVDHQTVDLQKLAKDITGSHILPHCEDSCKAETCRNEATCVEDFSTGTPLCECRFPEVQSGANCEIDINHASSVSFHGGHLMYSSLSQSPLTSPIVASFRTDQPAALLLFAHDQNNNFVQIHLSDEVNVTLTVNRGDQVEWCTVTAPETREEYSNMQWTQLSLRHSDDGSTLSVDEEACTIRSKIELSPTWIAQLKNVFTDIVTIPVGLQKQAGSAPLTHLFVGGVERGEHPSKGGAMRLRPIYQADIPDTLGCMRGVRVGGEVVDMRDDSKGDRSDDKTLVRTGCELGCGALDCNNGGHCAVGWRDYTPAKSHASCDCRRTSYQGEHCTLDDGISFTNSSRFSFDIDSILNKFIDKSSLFAQTIQFAFSAKPPVTSEQTLAAIYFADDRTLTVSLHKNGSLAVSMDKHERVIQKLVFRGNYTDGHRHFFIAEFNRRAASAFKIDSMRLDFAFIEGDNLDVFDAEAVYAGGKREGDGGGEMDYTGCISNMDIDFHYSSLHFLPLAYLGNLGHPYAAYARLTDKQGNLLSASKHACAPFKHRGVIPVQNTADFPSWSTNFHRMVYTGPVDPYTHDQPSDHFSWLWILLLVLVLLFLALFICLCVYCCCLRGKKRDDAIPADPHETYPLHPVQPVTPTYPTPGYPPVYIPTTPTKPHSNFHIPDADVDFDEPRKPADSLLSVATYKSGLSGKSGMTAYYTAPEYDSSDMDETLKDYDEGESMTPTWDDSAAPRSFNRQTPQRMSSFRSQEEGSPPSKPRRLVPVPPPRIN